jgi:hypothetical protein
VAVAELSLGRVVVAAELSLGRVAAAVAWVAVTGAAAVVEWAVAVAAEWAAAEVAAEWAAVAAEWGGSLVASPDMEAAGYIARRFFLNRKPRRTYAGASRAALTEVWMMLLARGASRCR